MHRGLCNLRSIPLKYRELGEDLSAAYGKFRHKPLEAYWRGEAAPQHKDAGNIAPDPTVQPVVTVMHSEDPNIVVGSRMTLAAADKQARDLDQRYHREKPDRVGKLVQYRVDFVRNNAADRYYISPRLGSGHGGLIEHLKAHLDSYRSNPAKLDLFFSGIPDDQREDIRAVVLPGIRQSIKDSIDRMVPYFEQHNHLSVLEVSAIGELSRAGQDGPQAEYGRSVLSYVDSCRKTLNTSSGTVQLPEPPKRNDFPVAEPLLPERPTPTPVKVQAVKRASTRGQLQAAIKQTNEAGHQVHLKPRTAQR